MDRRKGEAQNQLQNLKEECEITTELLNKLIQKCSKHVKEIANLDSKGFRTYSKYFLAVLQFQSISMQKIIELNLDLEEFLTEKEPADLQHLSLINCTNHNSISSTEYQTKLEENISSPPPPTPSSFVPYLKETESVVEINLENNNVIDEAKVKDDIELKILEDNSIKVQNNLVEEEINKNQLSANSSINETVIENYNNEIVCNSLNESLTSSENFYSISEDISSYAEFSSDLEDNDQEKLEKNNYSANTVVDLKQNKKLALNISERLKTLPNISLQDKFFDSLPKEEPIPDISLRPVSETTKKQQLDIIPVNKNSLTLENINKACGLSQETTKLKVQRKKFQEYKNAEDFLGIADRKAPQVGDICMIGYVQSPSEIYIQVADENSNSLDVLSMQLSEFYANSPFIFTSKIDAMNKFGDFWILNYNNDMSRVEILDWQLDKKTDEVEVQLIDYGWKCRVSISNLRPLDFDLRDLPRMAQLCHFGYLYPPGSTKNRRLKIWPEEINEGFWEVLGNLDVNTFKLVHVYYCKERKSYEIDLVKINDEEDDNDDEYTIGQILVDNNLAVEIIDSNTELLNNTMKEQIRTAHGLNGITQNMSVDEILEKYFQENVDEEPATLSEAVMHYNPRDEAETCKNLRRNGTCFKGKSCKFRHTPLKHGFTSDKEPVYNKAFQEDPLPSTNDQILLVISHIDDIRSFYAQIRRNNPGNGSSLNNLIKTMNNPDVIKFYEKLKLPPSRCQMVIAKHWNSYWYRAQVRNVHIPEGCGNITVEVFIVDFGDTLEVPMSDLRVITSDLLHMSFQAFECKLYNVKHKQGLDPDEEKRHFESQYLGQTFKATIIAVPGHLEVLLENNNGEDIGLKLIEDGFGELNTNHLFPSDDERILID